MAGNTSVSAGLRRDLAQQLYAALQEFVRDVYPQPSPRKGEPSSASGIRYLGEMISRVGGGLDDLAGRHNWRGARQEAAKLKQLVEQVVNELKALRCLNDLNNACDNLWAGRGGVAVHRNAILLALDELVSEHPEFVVAGNTHPRYVSLVRVVEPLFRELAKLARQR